jgi:RNA polymerase sigma-70 factor (ECF subfamily)
MSKPGPDVAQSLTAARAGSREAMEQALEACRGYLLMVAWQHLEADLQAKGSASDLVQETFLAAYQHFDQFRGTTEAELLGWLRQTLLNRLAKMRRRYRGSRKRRLDAEVPLAVGDSSAEEGNWLANDDSSPSAHVMREEDAEAVRQALERLPPDYRQVILLRVREQLSFEDISRHMGRSANAVEKLFARAIRAARQELETPQ